MPERTRVVTKTIVLSLARSGIHHLKYCRALTRATRHATRLDGCQLGNLTQAREQIEPSFADL